MNMRHVLNVPGFIEMLACLFLASEGDFSSRLQVGADFFVLFD